MSKDELEFLKEIEREEARKRKAHQEKVHDYLLELGMSEAQFLALDNVGAIDYDEYWFPEDEEDA